MTFPQVPLDDDVEDWRNRPINYGFSSDYPIFWGPNQLTIYPDTYMNPIGFTDKTLLTPPVVFRGFAGGKNISPPPPPPPISQFSLCIPGSGNGFVLLAFRYGRTSFYRTGLSDHRCCPNPGDVPYRYLSAVSIVQEGSFTYAGNMTTVADLLPTRIRMEPHAKLSWQSLMNRDYAGEAGRTITQIDCGIFEKPFCTYDQANIVVNAGADLGPATAIYNTPLELPWAFDSWLQLEIKWSSGGPALGGDGKFTVYYFMDCINGNLCAAALSGWNPEPDRSQLTDCGRLTPLF